MMNFSTNGMVSALYLVLSSICYVVDGGSTGITNTESKTSLFPDQVTWVWLLVEQYCHLIDFSGLFTKIVMLLLCVVEEEDSWLWECLMLYFMFWYFLMHFHQMLFYTNRDLLYDACIFRNKGRSIRSRKIEMPMAILVIFSQLPSSRPEYGNKFRKYCYVIS